MDIQISVKIKIAKGKEITLSGADARALYYQLKEIYDKPVNIDPPVIIPWDTTAKPLVWYYPDVTTQSEWLNTIDSMVLT